MKQCKFLLILVLMTTAFSSCNNDDANLETCNNYGLSYTLGNSAAVLASDIDLKTELFPNNTIVNGQSVPSIEIYGYDANNDFIVFTTEVLILNASGIANLSIGSANNEIINVTCLATDNTVGGVLRFQFSGTYNNNSIQGEFCVIIDSVKP